MPRTKGKGSGRRGRTKDRGLKGKLTDIGEKARDTFTDAVEKVTD